LLQADSLHDLPHSETTLATHLRAAGYQTALVGKWHLGNSDHYPETHGFDVNIGGTRWGAPQTFFWPYSGSGRFGGEFRYVPHLEFGVPGEYLTDRLTDEALRVLDHFRQSERPFFLYLAHHAPHTPIEAKPADVDHFRQRLQPGARHQNAHYAAMVRSLDESVGRVASYLKQHDLEDNSLVVFASDNGGYIGTMQDTGQNTGQDTGQTIPITTNSPLRSGKGTLYEGGLRVPLIVRWPREVPAGITCNTPVVLTDLFPTLAAAAGLTLPANVPVDGLDLSPLLHDPKATLAREEFYFHYPHYYHAPPSTPVSAVRVGNWKLLEYYEDQHVELYDLSADAGEEHDLASVQPDRVADLRERLTRWKLEVEAKLPVSNPDYERVR
jgi:arylsulfatase A-like enzyme